MFKLSGEKLYLSSGMASATSMICLSMLLISLSTAEAMVGGGDGCACGTLAGAALFVDCPKTVAVEMSSAISKKIGMCFIE
jgi:hypothetical protein